MPNQVILDCSWAPCLLWISVEPVHMCKLGQCFILYCVYTLENRIWMELGWLTLVTEIISELQLYIIMIMCCRASGVTLYFVKVWMSRRLRGWNSKCNYEQTAITQFRHAITYTAYSNWVPPTSHAGFAARGPCMWIPSGSQSGNVWLITLWLLSVLLLQGSGWFTPYQPITVQLRPVSRSTSS